MINSAGFATKDGTKGDWKVRPVPGTVLHDDGRSYFG